VSASKTPPDLGIEWDAENRLITVKQGGNPLATFTYDGNGRRSTKSAGGATTTYVYDGPQFLEERPTAGSTKRYVYGPGIDRPLAQNVGGVISYFIADHLGSVARTTDATGAPSLTREYDPWGNLLQGSTTGGYAFTGREWDAETTLYYYRARYYGPALGRFLGQDPHNHRDGLSFYTYVANNPIGVVDPSGLCGAKPTPCPDPACIKRAEDKRNKCIGAAWNEFVTKSTPLIAELVLCGYLREPRARLLCVTLVLVALAVVEDTYSTKKFDCLYAHQNDLDKCFAPCR
jgi:RHS repeat-associated protein